MENGKRLSRAQHPLGCDLLSVKSEAAPALSRPRAPILPFKLRSCNTRYKPLKDKTNGCRLTKVGKPPTMPGTGKSRSKNKYRMWHDAASQGVENVKRTLLKIAATGMLLFAPAIAQAAEGFATTNVNMRAGPSTAYPAVTVIPAGESIEIFGCLADAPWCDVEFYGGRGWVHGAYIQALYQQRRVYIGPEYYRPLGIPVVRL